MSIYNIGQVPHDMERDALEKERANALRKIACLDEWHLRKMIEDRGSPGLILRLALSVLGSWIDEIDRPKIETAYPKFEFTEENCPGHIAGISEKKCARCGIDIGSLNDFGVAAF